MHDHTGQIAEGVHVVSISKLESLLLNLEQHVTSYDVLGADEKAVSKIINILDCHPT
jgi:hypothetical protein